MSAVLEPKTQQAPANVADMSAKLAFSKKLQAVTNRIHSTNNADEIILDVSRDICQLFEADRFTVTLFDRAGKVVRTERFTRTEIEETVQSLRASQNGNEPPEAAARWKRIAEIFPKAAEVDGPKK